MATDGSPTRVTGDDMGPCWRCGGTGRLVKREGGYVPCPVCSGDEEAT